MPETVAPDDDSSSLPPDRSQGNAQNRPRDRAHDEEQNLAQEPTANGPARRPLLFGVASAALQIEGAVTRDGRGRSIWEDFQSQPGAIAGGATLDDAVLHYDNVASDVELIAAMEVDAYRFSVSWPRVVPGGTGAVNAAGLGFYDRLVDLLLAAGIAPVATLYHWDLPSAMQARGGWANRSTAVAFADYAAVVASRLGDRVSHWGTVNEPRVAGLIGHAQGKHAPGLTDLATGIAASHHLLVGHGLATQAVRAEVGGAARVGITIDMVPQRPENPGDERHVHAAHMGDLQTNGFFLDAVMGHGYPPELVEAYGAAMPTIRDGDMDVVAEPTDFLGINHYRSETVEPIDEDHPEGHWAFAWPVAFDGPATAMGWNIDPPSLREVIDRAVDRGATDVMITESGMATEESLDDPALVDDQARVAWLADHLQVIHAARAQGVPVSGYFVWTLMDNFEWGEGYRPRFGLVATDDGTDLRLPKASARWYRDHIRSHRT